MTALTARRLNRATLARQMLLAREPLNAADAVRRVVALQAQEPASPYLALFNRVERFDPAQLDAAFEAHDVVKASLMRITLHAVHAEDHAHLHTAMRGRLRDSCLGDRRFLAAGLTVEQTDALVPHVLAFAGQARTTAEIAEHLAGHVGAEPDRGLWWAMRRFTPVVHAPTGAPWSFGRRPSYVAPRAPVAELDRAASARYLVRRYLEGFGPASVADIAQFTLLTRPSVRAALGEDLVAHEGPDGVVLHDAPGAPLPEEDVAAPPRLMAMWDSVLLAYADRGRVIPDAHRAHVIRRNGDVLPTLLVDGHVAGVWRVVDGGIEATAFERLDDAAWDGLAAEARALTALLADREPAVYSRYAHWWAKLPAAAEVRLL